MRARLTQIGIHTGVRVFEIGDEVVRGEDLDEATFDARLAAGTAVLAGEAVSPAMAAAIAAYSGAVAPMRIALLAMVEQAEAGGFAEARALDDVLSTPAEADGLGDRINALYVRLQMAMIVGGEDLALSAEAYEAETARIAEASQLQPGSSPAQGGDEAGGDDRAPPAEIHSEAVEPAPALTDAPQPSAGTDGDAAGAPAPAAEPAAPATSSTPSRKPARKGAAKGG